MNNLYEDDLITLVAKYKFTIAIENAICDDYITEKLWRPLIAGSVPIYLGSPSVEVRIEKRKYCLKINILGLASQQFSFTNTKL